MGSELKQKLFWFIGILVLSIVLLVPSFLKYIAPNFGITPPENLKWAFSQPVALGLDLSGGVQVTYEVKTPEAVKARVQALRTSARAQFKKEKVVARDTIAEFSGSYGVDFSVLSERSEQRVREIVAGSFPEISFVSREVEGQNIKLRYGFSEAAISRIESDSVSRAIETLRSRIDQFGVTEPQIQRSGTKRISVQVPGETDLDKVKRIVGKVAKLEFRLVPLNAESSSTETLRGKANEQIKVEDTALMTGAAISNATMNFTDGEIVVDLKFTPEGTKQFAEITRQNVGRNLAIILDGVVFSAPVIKSVIPNGQAIISGSFTGEAGKTEAKDLAIALRSGALPAPLEVMEERLVGPTLGLDSIQKGFMSMAIGLLSIIVCMVVYYRGAGLIAVASLVLNLIFMLAMLSMWGSTLTLPGLAGLALTLGMAVDSNVIIYERIRDELKLGNSPEAAVQQGFDRALVAVIDSNLTTLLSAMILFIFGTGPIRGFAVTLSVGIISTIFCATFCSRLGFQLLSLRGKKALSI